jgi:hypothetical protein
MKRTNRNSAPLLARFPQSFSKARPGIIALIFFCVWFALGGLVSVQAAPADRAVTRAEHTKSTGPAQVEQILDDVLPTVTAPGHAPALSQVSLTAAAPLDLISGFDAIPYTGWYPPDPIIAAGPASLIVMVNSQIVIFDKQGTKLFQQSLGGATGFWKAQKASSSVGDPWVIYDPHTGRFIAIAADFGSKIGFLYLAISKSSTPMGSADWHKYALNLTGTHQDPAYGGEPTFPDYPKAGVDDKALYITGNHFGINSDVFSHNQIIAINKSSLLSGGSANIVYQQIFTTTFGPLHPTMVHEPASPMYFVTQDPNVEAVSIYALANVLTSPSLTASTVLVPAFDQPPDVPQLGGGEPLDSIGSRFMSGVVRNGSLWTAHAISDPAVDGEAVVRWYQFDVTGFPGSGATLIQSGNVDPGPDIHTWMTHINVDASGNMGIGFSIGGPTQYAAIGYTGRLANDPLGTTEPVRTARVGKGNYQQIDGGGRNRWGDYSGLAIDPDGCTFWQFHEYPTSANTWATFVGAFQVDRCPLPPVADAGPDQTVTDTDGDGFVTVTLDGSASFDPDGGAITLYQWATQPASADPTFMPALAVGTHTIALTVTDDEGATDTDQVVVTVRAKRGK